MLKGTLDSDLTFWIIWLIWSGRWHFHITTVQTDEAVQRLLKTWQRTVIHTRPSNSRILQKKNRRYLGNSAYYFMYVLILLSIWPIASWIFSYKKGSCPHTTILCQQLQIGKSIVNSRNCRSSLIWLTIIIAPICLNEVDGIILC